MIKTLLEFQSERIIIVTNNVQDLVLGGGGQLLLGQPGVDPGLEVGGDGADVDQGVRDPHRGVLVLSTRLRDKILLTCNSLGYRSLTVEYLRVMECRLSNVW